MQVQFFSIVAVRETVVSSMVVEPLSNIGRHVLAETFFAERPALHKIKFIPAGTVREWKYDGKSFVSNVVVIWRN